MRKSGVRDEMRETENEFVTDVFYGLLRTHKSADVASSGVSLSPSDLPFNALILFATLTVVLTNDVSKAISADDCRSCNRGWDMF